MGVDYDVDLAVIGSGGAAMSAAIAASQAGKSVVLVERGVLGGTCVNIGCVPSKTLLAAAGARHAALTNPFKGAPTSAAPVNLGDLVAQKDALIERLRDAKYADVAAAYGFQVRPGQASFLDGDTLAVDGQAVEGNASRMSRLVNDYNVGDRITVTWRTASGEVREAEAVLQEAVVN